MLEQICLSGCSKPSLLPDRVSAHWAERPVTYSGTLKIWIWKTPEPDSLWQSQIPDPTQESCETWFELSVKAFLHPHGFATFEFLLRIPHQNKPQLSKQPLVNIVKFHTSFSLKYHTEHLIWCDFNAHGYLKLISCTSKVGQCSFSNKYLE